MSINLMYFLVQFCLWFKLYFRLFLGMVMYDNEFKTKGNKISTKDKTEPQHVLLILHLLYKKSLRSEN